MPFEASDEYNTWVYQVAGYFPKNLKLLVSYLKSAT